MTTTIEQLLPRLSHHWNALASFAWSSFQSQERGVVAVHHTTLESDECSSDAMHFIVQAYVPKADDWAQLIEEYDPEQEILLLVGMPDGTDTMLRLAGSDTRPGPAQVDAAASA